jgi:site-specific recombinase XerD
MIMKKTREYIDSFLAKIEKMDGKSLNTVNAYKSDLNSFCNYCEDNKFETIDNFKNFTQIDMDNFFTSLDVAPNTYNRRIVAVMEFIKYLNERSIFNGSFTIKNRKVAYREPVSLSNDERARLLENVALRPYKLKENGKFIKYIAHPKKRSLSCNHKRDKAMVLVMLLCGLRASECINLKKENIIFDNINKLKFVGKGDKERTVPMPQQVKDAIDKWLKCRNHDSEYLFTRCSNGIVQVVSANLLTNKVKTYYQMSDIDYSSEKRPCHKLRKTYITRLLENGVGLAKVQQLAGHASILTTQKYIGKLGGDEDVLDKI